ncbi:MAG: hypothetical protein IKN62_01260 [Elusimicrobia bacterium]|nr:hypothetical protein [Elusimicrobiota bacterium]
MSAEKFRVKNYKSKEFFKAIMFEENFGFILLSEIFKLELGSKFFKRMAFLLENENF